MRCKLHVASLLCIIRLSLRKKAREKINNQPAEIRETGISSYRNMYRWMHPASKHLSRVENKVLLLNVNVMVVQEGNRQILTIVLFRACEKIDSMQNLMLQYNTIIRWQLTIKCSDFYNFLSSLRTATRSCPLFVRAIRTQTHRVSYFLHNNHVPLKINIFLICFFVLLEGSVYTFIVFETFSMIHGIFYQLSEDDFTNYFFIRCIRD